MAQTADTAALRRQWGTTLREARRSKGLTQSELADLADIDQANVSRVENGQGGLTAVISIAVALGVVLDWDSAA